MTQPDHPTPWISVSDRLPTREGRYLICSPTDDRPFVAIDHWHHPSGRWDTVGMHWPPSHWMDLPRLPGEESTTR